MQYNRPERYTNF